LLEAELPESGFFSQNRPVPDSAGRFFAVYLTTNPKGASVNSALGNLTSKSL
jgi:hypothetical protein